MVGSEGRSVGPEDKPEVCVGRVGRSPGNVNTRDGTHEKEYTVAPNKVLPGGSVE